MQKLIDIFGPDVCFQGRWIHSRRLSGNRCHANLSLGVRRLWFQVLIQCHGELDGRERISGIDNKFYSFFFFMAIVILCSIKYENLRHAFNVLLDENICPQRGIQPDSVRLGSRGGHFAGVWGLLWNSFCSSKARYVLYLAELYMYMLYSL